MTDTKPCQRCGTTLHKGKLSSYNWKCMRFCKTCKHDWSRRNNTQYDTCKHCGETKPIAKFRKNKSPKGYCQPCKSCDSARNKIGGNQMDTSHLDPYLTIPWTKAA